MSESTSSDRSFEATDRRLQQARERTLHIVEEIRAGRVEVAPSDRDKCRFCDCKDVCRIETVQPAAVAEGA